MSNKHYTKADLFHEWREMSAKRFDNKKLEKQKIMDAIQSNSQLTIVTLKRGLRSKIKWSVITISFLVVFAMLTFDYDSNIFSNSNDFWFLAITSILTIAICLFLYYKFRKMDDDFSNQTSLLETMKNNLKTIKDALFVERVFGYTAFFIFFIFQTYTWLSYSPSPKMIICMMVKKFGKHIKELEENIIRLDTLQ